MWLCCGNVSTMLILLSNKNRSQIWFYVHSWWFFYYSSHWENSIFVLCFAYGNAFSPFSLSQSRRLNNVNNLTKYTKFLCQSCICRVSTSIPYYVSLLAVHKKSTARTWRIRMNYFINETSSVRWKCLNVTFRMHINDASCYDFSWLQCWDFVHKQTHRIIINDGKKSTRWYKQRWAKAPKHATWIRNSF